MRLSLNWSQRLGSRKIRRPVQQLLRKSDIKSISWSGPRIFCDGAYAMHRSEPPARTP